VPFDQRRATEEQACVGASKTEIVIAIFTQTPKLMHGGSAFRGLSSYIGLKLLSMKK
jgi:hypothetical protein